MHVLNSQDLSVLGGLQELRAIGIARLRIDGRTYSSEQVKSLVKKYREALEFSGEAVENLPGTTRGHYYRGVL